MTLVVHSSRFHQISCRLRRRALFSRGPVFFSSFSSFSRRASASLEADQAKDGCDQDLFEFTSGRWIFNESLRMAERRLTFNVSELKNFAAKALNRPVEDVKTLRKIAEGSYNRILEVTMNDGSSILARLPYPSTLPRHLAVASEVTTLDFLRTNGIPTPRILDYSTREDAVGSEYMLMEGLPGKPLSSVWVSLTEEERYKILHQIITMEATLFAIKLPASVSIYYARDLPRDTPRIDIPGFENGLCIGPYASLQWWYGERGNQDIDRGPHIDPQLVLRSHAEKELVWIRDYGRPRYPFYREYNKSFRHKKQDPQEHVRSLKDYLCLVPHLVFTDPTAYGPTLRHPDLTPNNILISDDLIITGFIDWQHSVILPAFLAADIPTAFQNYADEGSRGFKVPKLPENLHSMDEKERAEAEEQYRRRHIHFYYLGFTKLMNEPHWRAYIEHNGALLTRRIFRHAGALWEGDNAHLQIDMSEVVRDWSIFASAAADGKVPACPVVIEEQEVQRREDLRVSLPEDDAFRERWTRALGIDSTGYVSREEFDVAKEKARIAKEYALNELRDDPLETEKFYLDWPFDDFDENE